MEGGEEAGEESGARAHHSRVPRAVFSRYSFFQTSFSLCDNCIGELLVRDFKADTNKDE